ncbi:DNA polymerase III subunit gamma/tau [Wohlfahrtiimonas chitiniclastica]|uniref:DNA polymerase III subunit gamma/tau n=1 Tax=Wohlfahrtiimonas chitiniclastica TaxID=400946 RepID=A0AB35BXF8_9GAMM|nr:DNA polymerase III subunit gamma/tau [Wohlfahrtiimonas chitiniclastica]MBS7823731.1 DNA polymerase III subunit gamma/tau [Wohlfahrtiimonas chitiniclastica]MBS7839349.1 DNA polymerase III subunit gamma/tau [Wohlfahrtiimonas chitiniclastica]
MATQALARKWRPKNFHEVVGQKHVVTALTNGLDNNRLHHAFLLTGTRGVGKTTLARILAKSLNCEQGISSHPCGVCSICQEVDQGRFVDLIEIDAASRTKVEDTREILDNVQYAPTRGRYKVYLIDEVHMLSNSSFNALLKTLEEPPEHVKFILATTDPQKLPVTVLSRCLRFHLKKIPAPEITSYLTHIMDAEGIDYQNKALELIAKAGAGSMRDSLSLLDQGIAYTNGHVAFEPIQTMLGLIDDQYALLILRALATLDQSALLAASKQVMDSGADPYALLEALIEAFHQLTLLQIDASFIDLDDTHQDAWQALATAMSAEDLQLYYQIALHGRKDLEMHPEPLIGLEMTLLRMLLFTPKGAPKKSAVPSVKTQPSTTPIVHAPQTHNEPTVSLATLLDEVQAAPEVVTKVEPVVQPPVVEEIKIAEPTPEMEPEPEIIPMNDSPVMDAPIYDDVPPWIDAEQYESIAAVPAPIEPEIAAPVASIPAESVVASTQADYPLNNNEDWLEIVRNLSISGLTLGIVRNLVLERFSDDWLVLKRSREDHAFNIPDAEANIAKAVSELLGRDIRCSIVATEQVIEEDDFNHRAEKELEARKVQVLADIHADPVVQFLVNMCDAEVLDSTLKLKHE